MDFDVVDCLLQHGYANLCFEALGGSMKTIILVVTRGDTSCHRTLFRFLCV